MAGTLAFPLPGSQWIDVLTYPLTVVGVTAVSIGFNFSSACEPAGRPTSPAAASPSVHLFTFILFLLLARVVPRVVLFVLFDFAEIERHAQTERAPGFKSMAGAAQCTALPRPGSQRETNRARGPCVQAACHSVETDADRAQWHCFRQFTKVRQLRG